MGGGGVGGWGGWGGGGGGVIIDDVDVNIENSYLNGT